MGSPFAKPEIFKRLQVQQRSGNSSGATVLLQNNRAGHKTEVITSKHELVLRTVLRWFADGDLEFKRILCLTQFQKLAFTSENDVPSPVSAVVL